MDDAPKDAVSDPVIEAYKQHVDRSLLIENLRRTPEERLLAMIGMLDLAADLREAMQQRTKQSR